MLAHPEVMRYYPKCYTRSEAAEWMERQYRRYAGDGHGLWLVLLRDNLEPVGQVGLLMQEVDGIREPEIGYLIHHPYWRRGYASEAAISVRGLAFDRMGLPYVISLIRPENIPSRGVARRIGMTPVKETLFHGYRHLVFRVARSEAGAGDGA
jgi:RimJ/RimL family protein N-acetyltransferase